MSCAAVSESTLAESCDTTRELTSGSPAKAFLIRRRIRRSCSVKMLKRRVPIIQWLPTVTVQSAFYDCIAGFTVALTAIPQSIAYAAVAGLPLEYGLYTVTAFI